MANRAPGIEIISTCPPSSDGGGGAEYCRRVAEVARWSERAGCTGTLIYTDNGLVDPWLVAQLVVLSTERLCPLVAVQPVYMHPYSVAKMVATIGHLHGRRVDLNLVAGGFKHDLEALDDHTPHDARYDRVIEYGLIVKGLLQGERVSHEGAFYRVKNLRLSPQEPPDLSPWLFVSGSSEAGMSAAALLGARPVMYPMPPSVDRGAPQTNAPAAVRVGIVARETEEEAWKVARTRFPEDRKGQLTHELAMKASDSSWHKQLSELAVRGDPEPSPYWLHPFQCYKTFCPYLVGSHATVAGELSRYIALGYRTFLVDVPASEEELSHMGVTFRMAREMRS
jgi:alkanesulfonate monooxygenase